MNKVKGALWTKVVALVVVAVSTVWLTYGCFGMILFGEMSSESIPTEKQKLREYIESNMAENYGAMTLNNAISSGLKDFEVTDPQMFGGLEGGSLDYSVEEQRIYYEDGEVKTEVKTVYGDEKKVSRDNAEYRFALPTDGCGCSYSSVDSVAVAFETPHVWRSQTDYCLVDKTSDAQLQVQIHHEGNETIVSADGKDVLEDVSIDEENYDEEIYNGEEATDDEPEKVDQIVVYTIYMKLGAGYSVGKTQYFENGVMDRLPMANDIAVYLNTYRDICTPIFVISLIVLVAAGIYLCCVAGHRSDKDGITLRMIDRMPYGIYAAIAVLGVGFGIAGVCGCVMGIYQVYFSFRDGVLLAILCIVGSTLLAAAFCMSTAVRLKAKKFWRYTICHYIVVPFKKMGHGFGALWKLNRSLAIRTAVAVGIVTMLQLIVVGATGYAPGAEVVFFCLYKCVELPFIAWIVWQMERIRLGGRRAAAGDYTQPIDTNKMLPAFKEHAENINNVSDGISVAVQEQMKSEHLKTELITNVSHDIKTPLTSIINYVDLIKKEKVENATVREYVEVLDRQSARLKKLIEDLLEASKASTGNIDVHLQACDAGVMISQAVGEYQEKLQARGLEVVVTGPEVPATIQADGRHLWRVLNNIMSNINKYAQEGTRVYVNVEVGLHQTKLIFKNISKYPLNISSEELMERFVRGDSSRNGEIEGHGLGLSIAQSLTELMGGNLDLEIDGDLFKVIVTMKR